MAPQLRHGSLAKRSWPVPCLKKDLPAAVPGWSIELWFLIPEHIFHWWWTMIETTKNTTAATADVTLFFHVFSWFSTVGLYSWHRCAQCIPFCSYFIWMHWYWYTTILGSVQPSATVLCRNVSAPWKNSSPDVICFLDCTATCLRSWGRGIHINIHHQIECFLRQPVSTFAVYHCWIANYRFCSKDPFSNKSQ